MESSPLVSVVIPAFNDARYVRQAIDSVLAQTYRPLQIIVVDDGSTDDTAQVARSFGAVVEVAVQSNRGAAAARNHALQLARGPYVAFLDADDFWHPRKLELQLGHLRSCGQCVAVYCEKVEVRNSGSQPPWFDARATPVPDPVPLSADDRASGWLYLELLRDSIVHTSTVLTSRQVLDRVGRFDETLRKGQDLEYWLRLSRLGPIHCLDAVLSAYRIHGDSISHRTMDTNYHAQVVERILREFGASDPTGRTLEPDEVARILGSSWFEFAYQHYRQGSLRICREGIGRALGYRPFELHTWALAARAMFKSVVRRRPDMPRSSERGVR